MGKVKWAPGIQSVSGNLAPKPKKDDPHRSDKQMLLAMHLKNSANGECARLFIRPFPKRSTPVKPEEIVARTRFAEVARAVNTRAHDLMQMTQDQAAFLAQKDQPNGKKTMKAYLWSLELAKYDAAHQG